MIAKLGKRDLKCANYEPTRLEIRRACYQIQATWSPEERAKRLRKSRGVMGLTEFPKTGLPWVRLA